MNIKNFTAFFCTFGLYGTSLLQWQVLLPLATRQVLLVVPITKKGKQGHLHGRKMERFYEVVY